METGMGISLEEDNVSYFGRGWQVEPCRKILNWKFRYLSWQRQYQTGIFVLLKQWYNGNTTGAPLQNFTSHGPTCPPPHPPTWIMVMSTFVHRAPEGYVTGTVKLIVNSTVFQTGILLYLVLILYFTNPENPVWGRAKKCSLPLFLFHPGRK